MMITVITIAAIKVSKDLLKGIKVKKAFHNKAITLQKIKKSKNLNKKVDQNKKDQGQNLHTIIIRTQEVKEEIKDLVEKTKR